jgi:CubicO group peptidase (beta-lactamase class C family)
MAHALSGDERVDALEQRIRALRAVQFDRPVGQAYAYSNAGYMILGLLVQQLSGQPYEAYMHEHIFAPLEMRQTFTDWTAARAHGAASGHRYWLGLAIAGDMPVDRGSLPAGAHTSASAEDVAHFLIAQLTGVVTLA